MISQNKLNGLSFAIVLLIASISLAQSGGGGPPFGCAFDTGTKKGCIQGTTSMTITTTSTGSVLSIISFGNTFASNPIITANLESLSDDRAITTGIINTLSFLAPGSAGNTWTAMPNAQTELFGTSNNEGAVEVTGTNDCNLIVNVISAGTATAFLKVQYNNPSDGLWYDLLPAQDVSIASTGLQINGNIRVAQGAKVFGGVIVRVVGYGGNGIVSPTFGVIELFCTTESTSMPTLYIGLITTTNFQMILDLGFEVCGVVETPSCATIGVPHTYTIAWRAIL